MTPRERKLCRDRLARMSLTAVKNYCQDTNEELAKLARGEYVDRLVSMLVDDLLGFDEPGWHSVSPMYGAIEYQGVMPQDVRRSGGDRMMNAALRMKSKSEGWQLMELLPPRQLVALVVNNLRERLELTQAEACKAGQWEQLVGLLQLRLFFTPAKLKLMSVANIKYNANLADQRVRFGLQVQREAA